MKSVLLLFAVFGLCFCVVQAAAPATTWGASPVVKASSSPVVTQSTLPTVAGVSAGITSTAVSKAATQTSRSTTSPTVRTTTARPATTTAVPPTKATTPQPTATPTAVASATTEETPAPTGEQNRTVPSPTDTSNTTLPTPWPNATTYEYYPTEYRTQDIDPGMTPYSGPTLLETAEPTPTWEAPVNLTNATPTDPQIVMPYFTAAVVESPTFEMPPGAYGVESIPSPTETAAPFPISGPQDAAGSSFLPRWLSYLLFIFLGISGVAGLALVGTYMGSRSADDPVIASALPSPAPSRAREARLLQPGAPEPTMEQQILIDRIAGFAPQSMHVERLGRNLLGSSRSRRSSAGPLRPARSAAHLLRHPVGPVPAPATDWARAHGFRILAADSSGMALVMPALSNGGRSVLGVLPVGEMVDGASPVPMPVLLTEGERDARSRPASRAGAAFSGRAIRG